jgi:hypothetical protein
MAWEPISPELALVDPELAARARAGLAEPTAPVRLARPPARQPETAVRNRDHRAYPAWARVTAALWLVVLGILVGGAAIPHAQDTPRVVPQGEDAKFCPGQAPTTKPPPVPPSRRGP